MRDGFIRTVLELAKTDRNIEMVTGDLGFGVLKPFWEAVPDQFINAGIAEQNMTSMAAGMALEGKTVYTYSIGNFPTLRCLEQIRNDCAYHEANVKIVCVGGGFVYGSLGMSHHATEDLAVMRSLPGIAVFAPADQAEAAAVARATAGYPGTCYIRLGRGGEKKVRESIEHFQVGKALPVQEGSGVAIFTTGDIYGEAAEAAVLLEEAGIRPTLYTFPTVKPIDRETILDCACRHELIVTCEEHNILGGLGTAVAEVLAESSAAAQLLRLGIEGSYCTAVGDQKYLRRLYGLTGEQIAQRILKELA
ncbi:MAG: transketolase [Oscillospiraceae bacterium]|nr:transketolase [Oscillospiraceae bacterium]